MTTPTMDRYPNPVYAAAGAGDAAYQQLRKLPETVTQLRSKAASADLDRLRERIKPAALRARLDTDKLREQLEPERLRDTATRGAGLIVTGAHAGRERAVALYEELVARGMHVLHGTPAKPAAIEDKPAGEKKHTKAAPKKRTTF
jgi:heparin binding hemagglutinin HbhA